MATLPPTLPPGVRDLSPDTLRQRQYVLHVLTTAFQRYGFQPLQTPALEHLTTLQGKYGDEGEQLLFKLLNSGDFWSKVPADTAAGGSKALLPHLANKGLRYDLTVPLARYVAAHRHALTFPFRRYQIQPVWRADRPQRGRYREFEQCDIDIVGTDSLLCEAEVLTLVSEVLLQLGLEAFTVRLNHRGLLQAIAAAIGMEKEEMRLCQALDTWDKVGEAAVFERLTAQGLSAEHAQRLRTLLQPQTDNAATLAHLAQHLGEVPALQDLQKVLHQSQLLGAAAQHLVLDPTLARGLTYYTGTVLEVTVPGVNMGSIGGGGRYDELTRIFGLKDTPGMGFSFGLERLCEVLATLDKFPTTYPQEVQVLITQMDEALLDTYLQLLGQLRQAGIAAVLYPQAAKLKKQLSYAHKLNIPQVLLLGEEEHQRQEVVLKDMAAGTQQAYSWEELVAALKNI